MSEQPNDPTRPNPQAAPYGSPPPYQQPPEQPYAQPGEPVTQPYPQGYPQPYPGQSYAGGYPEASQGVLALVLGLVGLLVVQLVAPFAWVVGAREVRAIDEGRRDPRNRGLGQAGMVLGIIGTVILGLAVVIGVIALVVLIVAGTSALNS